MTHPTDLDLQRLIDGELDDETTVALEKQLLANPDANKRWRELQRVDAALRGALGETLAPHGPIAFGPETAPEELHHHPRWGVAVAAAILAALTVGLWLIGQSGPTRPIGTPGTVANKLGPDEPSTPTQPTTDTYRQIERMPVNVYNPETDTMQQLYVDYEQETEIACGREL